MRQLWNFKQLLLLLLILDSSLVDLQLATAQKPYYRRSYYSSVAPPSPARFSHGHAHSLVPLTYRGDLQSDESKRRDVTKKYAKKKPYRHYGSEEDDYSSERYAGGASSEYSNESQFTSRENDSREYTIGTQIRVQHPITVPKKTTSPYAKQSKYITSNPYKTLSGGSSSSSSLSYNEPNYSIEDRAPEPPPPTSSLAPKRHAQKYTQLYEPDPFHLVPPPKATAAAASNSYSVYEPDQDDYDVLLPSRTKSSYNRFKGLASKKHIEAYVEDQKKLLDEALKLQLLNDPKIQKYLKSKVKESSNDGLELEDFETYPPNLTPPFRNNFNDSPPSFGKSGTRSRRRPSEIVKHSPNKNFGPLTKPKRKYRSTALVINV